MKLPVDQWSTSLSDRMVEAIEADDLSLAVDLARHGDGRARNLATEYQLMFRGLGMTMRLLASELAQRPGISEGELRELWEPFFGRFARRGRRAWPNAGEPPGLTDSGFAAAADVATFLSWAERSFKADQATRAARICERIEAADCNAALDQLGAKTSDSYRPMHDLLIDQVGEVLGSVARREGSAGLENVLLGVAESQRVGVDAWEEGGTRGVAEAFAHLLVQHLSNFDVIETTEGFIIDQRFCGSGGRLIRDGAYEGPSALPVITGPSDITGQQPQLPAYCAHCPAWNTIAPQRWYGHPHVVLDDPARADGSCRLLIPTSDRRDD